MEALVVIKSTPSFLDRLAFLARRFRHGLHDGLSDETAFLRRLREELESVGLQDIPRA